MKPTNWRQFFGYRPSRSLSMPARADCGAYVDWLVAECGGDRQAAQARIARQHELMKRPLVVATFGRASEFEAPAKAKADPVARVLAAIGKLPWPALERVQAAIDERLAA